MWLLIREGWRELADTDFSKIQYPDKMLAEYLGMALAAIVLLKLVLVIMSRKNSRAHSGLFNFSSSPEIFIKPIRTFAWLLFSIPLSAILIALTDPSVSLVEEVKEYVETRIRVDLRDDSGSMNELFKNTGRFKSEIAAEAHLKFLEMRKGKHDRVSFWLFGNSPVQVSDFTVDEDVYFFQVYDAERRDNGGTEMAPVLGAVIKQFDEDDDRQKKSPHYASYQRARRSIVMITDAAIYDFEDTEKLFGELKKRRIIPYIIWIDETNGEPHSGQLTNIDRLLNLVVLCGGKFFPVSNERSLEQAYVEIDKLEPVKFEITKRVFRVQVFQIFVFIAVIALPLIILINLMVEMFFVPYP